jgi:sugar phosphate isomerase/epimerase
MTMKTGAQLYTIRKFTQTEKDIERSMKRVADMGYKTVQLSAMGPIAPQRMREICDENGLDIVLTHTDAIRILYDTEAVIKEHDIYGCDLIGIGSMPEKYRSEDWIDYFKADFGPAVKKIANAGKLFMYHNHDFEFAKINGRNFIERLTEQFSADEMGFTLDTYWVQAGGADVCYWIDQLKGRLPAVHLKDMAITPDRDRQMAPIGAGNLNWPAIFDAFAKAGTRYMLVEQDTCVGSPFDCLQASYDFLAKAGYR